jgi:hypothetical protein
MQREIRRGDKRGDGRVAWIQHDGFVNWLTPEQYNQVSEHAYRAAEFAVLNGNDLHDGLAMLFENVGETCDMLTDVEMEEWMKLINGNVQMERALMQILQRREV